MSSLLGRRNTANELSSGSVCQRCKRFEVDLTAASDNLNATDAELKASRQVISLLQRQLELFQVEKEGLEKLIVSQSNSSPDTKGSESIGDNLKDIETLKISEGTLKNIESCSPDEIQRKLLTLIKTQLYAKDEELVKLKSSLKEAQNEREQVNVQLHMLEDDISRLRSENSLLKDNLSLRDQTIESLSTEVFEQFKIGEYSGQRRQTSSELFSNETKAQQKKINKLSDTLDAYKKTNRLLSTNVIKLTEKCSQAEKKEIETRSQCQELEAKCCQIQSKLLSLLKEIEQSSKQASINQCDSDTRQVEQVEVIQSDSVKLLIKRLLEDKSLDIPLSWKEGNKSKRILEKKNVSKLTECDELGFYIVESNECQGYNEDNMSAKNNTSSPTFSSSVGSRASALRRGLSEATGFSDLSSSQLETVGEEERIEIDERNTCKSNSTNLQSIDAFKSDEMNWRLQWDEFIVEFDNIDLSKSNEFKRLLRTGVPQEYRCKVWKALIDLKIGNERKQYGPDYYQSLLEPNCKLSRAPSSIQNPSTKQIELDLLRTLPNNKYFENIDSTGTVRLRRVLTAFSSHKPKIGYCQGMNRLAAVALLVLPEEEAFWCLVAIVDKIMPSGYYNDLWLAQVDSNVVMAFVALKMPQLSEHFKRNGIELSLFAWFLTIFVDGSPPVLFLRLWDCFLYEGDKIMFRIALALLKKNEEELFKISNSVAANNFIRSAANSLNDIDGFFHIAFEQINPLPGRLLRLKREQYFDVMKSNFKSVGGSRRDSISESPDINKQAEDNDIDENISMHEDSSIISI